MAWFQLDSGYYTHPKTMRLRRAMGQEADTYPPRLWAWCSVHAKDGRPPPDLVEEACLWRGDVGRLVAQLTELTFLDPDGAVHDWMDWSGKSIAEYESKKEASKARAAASYARRLEEEESNSARILRAETAQSAPVLRESSALEKRREDEIKTTYPSPVSPSGVGQSVSPGKEKKARKQKAPDPMLEQYKLLASKYREDYHDTVDKEYGYPPEITAAEVNGARGFYRDGWLPERIEALKTAVLTHQTPENPKFKGWAFQVRSIAKLYEDRENLEARLVRGK